MLYLRLASDQIAVKKKRLGMGALNVAQTLEHLALLSLGLVAHSIHHTQSALGVSLPAPHHP
jgi:hypothetical protein